MIITILKYEKIKGVTILLSYWYIMRTILQPYKHFKSQFSIQEKKTTAPHLSHPIPKFECKHLDHVVFLLCFYKLGCVQNSVLPYCCIWCIIVCILCKFECNVSHNDPTTLGWIFLISIFIADKWPLWPSRYTNIHTKV